MESLAFKLFLSVLLFAAVSVLVWSSFQYLEAGLRLYREKYLGSLALTLTELFIFMDPKTLLRLSMVSLAVFLLVGLLLTNSLILLALFAAAGLSFPKLLVRYVKQRRFEQFGLQLVDSLMILSNSLRSGMNLVQAIEVLEKEQSPPISQEFGLVLREIRLGVSTLDALKNLTQRMPNDDLILIVTSMNIVLEMGGNLTKIFDTMATIIRERSKIELKTKALTAQGKMQGIVVGLLPTALGAAMFVMDPVMMGRMLSTVIGNVALAVMVAMQIGGYLLIRKITRIDV